MDKTDMRAVDVNSNLKNWPAWDYKDYRLNEKEAKPCTDALDNYIWHSVEKQGMPKEAGFYLFKVEDFVIDDDNKDHMLHYRYVATDYITNTKDLYWTAEITITHWRKIVDNENAYMEET